MTMKPEHVPRFDAALKITRAMGVDSMAQPAVQEQNPS